MSEIQELDESEMTAEEMMALHLMELIEAYETDDASFHLEVFTVDGRRHCLPYVEHSHGAVVLMDDSRPPPGPKDHRHAAHRGDQSRSDVHHHH